MSQPKRKALGADALDGLVPEPEDERRSSAATRVKVAAKAVVTTAREKITFALPRDLVEECRNAVDALSGPPVRLTLAAMVEQSLRAELKKLRRDFHDGKEFPTRSAELRAGRPMRR